MTVPACPVHNVPMTPSQRGGGFYCPQFIGVGQPGANMRGYCTQTARPAQVAPPAAPVSATPTPWLESNGDRGQYLLAAECVKAASLAFGPLPPNPEDHAAVMQYAVQFFTTMKAVIS